MTDGHGGLIRCIRAIRSLPAAPRDERRAAQLRSFNSQLSPFNRAAPRRALRLLRVGFHSDAGADEVAVAVDVVDAADARPELARPGVAIGEGGGLARIRPGPLVTADHLRGVWRVLQRVAGLVGLAVG